MTNDNEPCVEQCRGCNRAVSPESLIFSELDILKCVCTTCWRPEARWLSGKKCPFASHLVQAEKKAEKQIDPIKLSKLKMKGKK